MSSNQYFAAVPTDEIAQEILKRVEDYRTYVKDSGILRQLRASYRTYYTKSSAIEDVGQVGEFASLSSNEYANLVRNVKSMVASSKPAWDAKAANSDSKSLQSAQLSNAILEYVMTDKRCETNLLQALEMGLTLREGWILTEWDSSSGEDVAVEGDQFVKQGDIKLSNHNLLNVARDFTAKSMAACKWFVVTEQENKFELQARFQSAADKIIASSRESMADYTLEQDARKDNFESDQIEVHTFFHDRTAAMPQGRMTIVVANEVVFDGELPYQKLPLICLAPEHKSDTAFGWTLFFDLLGLQDASNLMLSTVVSNNRAFGIQSLLSKRGSGLTVQEISEGLNYLEYDGDVPPQPLQLTASSPETYNLIQQLNAAMERLSGVSQIARGSAPVGQLSGSQMALLQSQSIQFASSTNQAYTQCLEDVGTMIVSHYQRFASAPRVIQLAGKAGRNLVKEFSNQDLQGINRVTVSSGNPLSKTLQGRLEVAKDLLSNGLVKNAQEYLQVLTTGNIQPILEQDVAALNLIRSENEELTEGRQVSALVSDQHALHCQEHLTCLSSPEARQNPEIVQNVLAHVQEHLNLWRTADPMILQLTGTPPAPPIAPEPQAPGQAPVAVNDTTPPNVQQAEEVNQPNLPQNPMTGQKFDPSTGGL